MTTFPMAASYVSTSGRHPVADPADMTADEAKAVADYLIERKKAGQFRSFWSSWEESVSLLASKDVIAINCWEPAALEVQKAGGAVRYATTVEGYNKWMICAYVPTQVVGRNKYGAVAKVLEGFLGGLYAARMATRSGYATAIPEAGLAFAKENNLPATEVAAIEANIRKVSTKFAARQFWQTPAPKNMEAIKSEFSRFRNA
jgi:spermidine/putrescine-binding protein